MSIATLVTRPLIEATDFLLTAADLDTLPADLPSGPVKFELDNGRIVQRAPPGEQHGYTQSEICGELRGQGQKRGFGRAYSEVGVILWRNPDRVVGVDGAFAKNASLPIPMSPEGYLEKTPDLVVEIRSKNDRPKYVSRKVEDYLIAGAAAVLVIDPIQRNAAVHRPHAEPETFLEGDVLTFDDIIPGFRLNVVDLF